MLDRRTRSIHWSSVTRTPFPTVNGLKRTAKHRNANILKKMYEWWTKWKFVSWTWLITICFIQFVCVVAWARGSQFKVASVGLRSQRSAFCVTLASFSRLLRHAWLVYEVGSGIILLNPWFHTGMTFVAFYDMHNNSSLRSGRILLPAPTRGVGTPIIVRYDL